MVRKSLLVAGIGIAFIFLLPDTSRGAENQEGAFLRHRRAAKCPEQCPPGPRGAQGLQGQRGPRGAADNIYFVHRDMNMNVGVTNEGRPVLAQDDENGLENLCGDNSVSVQLGVEGNPSAYFDMDVNPPRKLEIIGHINNPVQKRVRKVQACVDFGAALE